MHRGFTRSRSTARRDNGEAVLVRLQPEPANAFDSRAILFQAFHLRIWQPCGYVVKEIVEDVHAAIEAQNISSVEFCWVRYKLWKKAPGYYAGINVTCHGGWPEAVHRARSTFY